jgi:hypothetical protein
VKDRFTSVARDAGARRSARSPAVRGPREGTLALEWQKHCLDLQGAADDTSAPGYQPRRSNAGGQTSLQSGYAPKYADPRGRLIYLNASHAFD